MRYQGADLARSGLRDLQALLCARWAVRSARMTHSAFDCNDTARELDDGYLVLVLETRPSRPGAARLCPRAAASLKKLPAEQMGDGEALRAAQSRLG